ncbi:cytochrome c3 family protein [Psychromonas sp.]|uniref:cytochrome c3 family protein n=1 Tax=Psychromonas sp. TaxID=1884585 RepID=UPI003564DC66
MKLIKSLLLGFVLCCVGVARADELPNPGQDNLANFHLKDEDCAGACHEKEAPSDDLEFERSSCIECHDEYGLLEGKWHNIKHRNDQDMACTECHIPHEKTDPKEFCGDCHDDDHAAFDPLFKETILEKNSGKFLKEK